MYSPYKSHKRLRNVKTWEEFIHRNTSHLKTDLQSLKNWLITLDREEEAARRFISTARGEWGRQLKIGDHHFCRTRRYWQRTSRGHQAQRTEMDDTLQERTGHQLKNENVISINWA